MTGAWGDEADPEVGGSNPGKYEIKRKNKVIPALN